jgi:hypothetical protein
MGGSGTGAGSTLGGMQSAYGNPYGTPYSAPFVSSAQSFSAAQQVRILYGFGILIGTVFKILYFLRITAHMEPEVMANPVPRQECRSGLVPLTVDTMEVPLTQ